MAFQRTVWIVAGAPRVKVDAVRHITVPATGTTAVELAHLLQAQKIQPVGDLRLLRSVDAQGCSPEMLRADNPFREIDTYETYGELEERLRAAVLESPNAVVVMSAAVNDYDVAQVSWTDAQGVPGQLIPGPKTDPAQTPAKLPSGMAGARIELKPTPKIIDKIRGEWSPDAYLVGFKNEPVETVVASGRKLMDRAGCHLVVANSIGLTYNAILRKSGALEPFATRSLMLQALARLIAAEDGLLTKA